MKQFVTRRLGYSLISLLVLSLTIFFFVRITGDPASLLVEPASTRFGSAT
jgi:ABC-type dipeptide/oligopeptide/nickel transport system permease component